MQDYDALRARVEETAKRMKEAQSQRSRGSQSLFEILGALESKFAAQERELAFYRDRIAPLEHANTRLTELIGKLLDMVDSGFGEDSLEPMRHATAMAAAMLDKDMAPVGDARLDAPGRFEDVDPETLAADAATAEDDLESLPEFVRGALVEQQSAAFEKALALNEAPETAADEDAPAEIEMIAESAEQEQVAAEIEFAEEPEAVVAEPEPEAKPEPKAKSEPKTKPEPEPAAAEKDDSVEAMATALDRKSASGEPLEAGDIRALLERVEALAGEPADEDDDDIDIPPARDEDGHAAVSGRRQRDGKTGAHG